MKLTLQNVGVIALIAMLAVSMTGIGAALNYSEDAKTPNPYLGSTVEKQSHDVANYGLTEYEADDGSKAQLNARVNPDSLHPVSFYASEVDYGQGEFPYKSDETDNSASTLDASEWMSSTNVSITDTKTADTVNGINIATDGKDFTSGDAEFQSYDNVSITSDESKRVLVLAGNVNQLESGAKVNLQFQDADGDFKSVWIDPSADQSAIDVVANSTGDGFLYQVQFGELTTQGNGDGDFNDIESIGVVTQDGDSDVTLTHVGFDRTKPLVFGNEYYDSNDDGEVTVDDETRDVTNVAPGERVSITGLDSMGTDFDDAVIYDMRVDVQFDAASLDSEDVKTSAEETESYPGYDVVADIEYRISLPEAYELTHTGTELGTTTKHPGERYLTVEYAEGVGDTDFADIDYANDVTGQFDAQGKTITLDSTIQPGQEIAIHHQLKLTQSEWDAMQNDGSAAGPTGKESGGGLTSLPVVGGLIAVLLGLAAKLRGSS